MTKIKENPILKELAIAVGKTTFSSVLDDIVETAKKEERTRVLKIIDEKLNWLNELLNQHHDCYCQDCETISSNIRVLQDLKSLVKKLESI